MSNTQMHSEELVDMQKISEEYEKKRTDFQNGTKKLNTEYEKLFSNIKIWVVEEDDVQHSIDKITPIIIGLKNIKYHLDKVELEMYRLEKKIVKNNKKIRELENIENPLKVLEDPVEPIWVEKHKPNINL